MTTVYIVSFYANITEIATCYTYTTKNAARIFLGWNRECMRNSQQEKTNRKDMNLNRLQRIFYISNSSQASHDN